MKMREKLYRALKGIFRVQTGFALVRVWALDKTHPRRTNVHMFDIMRKVKQRNRK